MGLRSKIGEIVVPRACSTFSFETKVQTPDLRGPDDSRPKEGPSQSQRSKQGRKHFRCWGRNEENAHKNKKHQMIRTQITKIFKILKSPQMWFRHLICAKSWFL